MKKSYSNLEDYLNDNQENIQKAVKEAVKKKQINDYIDYFTETYFGKDNKGQEHYLNFFLEEYSLLRKQDTTDENSKHNALTATFNQMISDYFMYKAYNTKKPW